MLYKTIKRALGKDPATTGPSGREHTEAAVTPARTGAAPLPHGITDGVRNQRVSPIPSVIARTLGRGFNDSLRVGDRWVATVQNFLGNVCAKHSVAGAKALLNRRANSRLLGHGASVL